MRLFDQVAHVHYLTLQRAIVAAKSWIEGYTDGKSGLPPRSRYSPYNGGYIIGAASTDDVVEPHWPRLDLSVGTFVLGVTRANPPTALNLDIDSVHHIGYMYRRINAALVTRTVPLPEGWSFIIQKSEEVIRALGALNEQ